MKKLLISALLLLASIGAVLFPATGNADGLSQSLPNPITTPGAINPDVTDNNIHATICVPGFTATIRENSYITNKAKRAALPPGEDLMLFEWDHLISLELGGHPNDPRNLWAEPYGDRDKDEYGARKKDVLETLLHRLVCADKMPLSAAQGLISGNWIMAYQAYVIKK